MAIDHTERKPAVLSLIQVALLAEGSLVNDDGELDRASCPVHRRVILKVSLVEPPRLLRRSDRPSRVPHVEAYLSRLQVRGLLTRSNL